MPLGHFRGRMKSAARRGPDPQNENAMAEGISKVGAAFGSAMAKKPQAGPKGNVPNLTDKPADKELHVDWTKNASDMGPAKVNAGGEFEQVNWHNQSGPKPFSVDRNASDAFSAPAPTAAAKSLRQLHANEQYQLTPTASGQMTPEGRAAAQQEGTARYEDQKQADQAMGEAGMMGTRNTSLAPYPWYRGGGGTGPGGF